MPKINLLSVVIPAFNEAETVKKVIEKVYSVRLVNDIQKEIIVVNDQSTDDTASEIESYIKKVVDENVTIISHQSNQGKGAAIRTGVERARGEYIIIQDADLELNPEEFNDMLTPIINEKADVVYGSRFLNTGSPKGNHLANMANLIITKFASIILHRHFSDVETCYKMVPTDIFKRLYLVENRFAFDPEITAKLSKIKTLKWAEVPISYNPRKIKEGKKINWQDGFRALYCIVKYGWFTPQKKSFHKKNPSPKT